ncbi:MAG: TapB family protein [bacterium]
MNKLLTIIQYKISLKYCFKVVITFSSFIIILFLSVPIIYSEYIPLKIGSYWIYTIHNKVGTFETEDSATLAIVGERDVKGKRCSVLEARVGGKLLTGKNILRTFFYDDKNGLITVNGFENEGGGRIIRREEYKSGYIQYKYPLYNGMSWTITSGKGLNPSSVLLLNTKMDDVDDDGMNDRVDITARVKVIGIEDLEVPAGLFTKCYKISYTYTMKVHCTKIGDIELIVSDTIWLKPYVGVVMEEKVSDWSEPFNYMEQRTVYKLIEYLIPE